MYTPFDDDGEEKKAANVSQNQGGYYGNAAPYYGVTLQAATATAAATPWQSNAYQAYASSMYAQQPQVQYYQQQQHLNYQPAYVSVGNQASMYQNNNLLQPQQQQQQQQQQQSTVWPDSLRRYAERAFKAVTDSVGRTRMQATLKQTIEAAIKQGTLQTIDWDNYPLPGENRGGPISQRAAPQRQKVTLKVKPSRAERLQKIKENQRILAALKGVQEESFSSFSSSTSTSSTTATPSAAFSMNRSNMPTALERLNMEMLRRKRKLEGAVDEDDNEGAAKNQWGGKRAQGNNSSKNSSNKNARKKQRTKRQVFKNKQKERQRRFGMSQKQRNNKKNKKKQPVFMEGDDMEWSGFSVQGTCTSLEKKYYRLTSAPDPSTVRPEAVLKKALRAILQKNTLGVDYLYCCEQLKSIRQDMTVQRIRNRFTVVVYEAHARIALENADLSEFNQCQTQLRSLYADNLGTETAIIEFTAYRLLYYLKTNSITEFGNELKLLPRQFLMHSSVQHAVQLAQCVMDNNFSRFFRLFAAAPNLSRHIISAFLDRIRLRALLVFCKAYRSLDIDFIQRQLAFSSPQACLDFLLSQNAVISADSSSLLSKPSLTAINNAANSL